MRLENNIDFRALGGEVSAQTLMLVERNYKAYFAALKEYKKNPTKFKGMPKPPMFKPKEKGRFIAVFTDRQLSKKLLKIGVLKINGFDIRIKSKHQKVNQIRIIPLPNRDYNIEIVYEVQEQSKKENTNYAGIDIGLNNLATIVTNTGNAPIIVNGKPIKAINQYYNKKKAQLTSMLPHFIGKDGKKRQRTSSKAIRKLTIKRNNKIKDYMHKASRKVVNELQQADISKVVIG
jgi:putative transposase